MFYVALLWLAFFDPGQFEKLLVIFGRRFPSEYDDSSWSHILITLLAGACRVSWPKAAYAEASLPWCRISSPLRTSKRRSESKPSSCLSLLLIC
jgi:hypothetical protein